MTITLSEQALLGWLDEKQPEMLALLEEIVNIDSGSHDKDGVDAVVTVLQDHLKCHDVSCSRIANPSFGDALRAAIAPRDDRPAILLMGHCDTVFGPGEVARRPFTIRGTRAYGPGVADMKSGLVMNVFLLRAFSTFDLAPAPLVALFTSDEEIASPACRHHIEAEARKARVAFNPEPGRANGNVVTGRKGGVFVECVVKGRAAHSGVNFTEGASAIEEIARKIRRWHDLTDLENGITVNVGLISGGQSINSVAPQASCSIDLRYVEGDDRKTLLDAITAIGEECSVLGTSAEIEIMGEFMPLVQSPASRILYDHYVSAASELRLSVSGEFTGGCADSGLAAAVGTPTLCAVGPVGGKAHTPDEYVELATLLARTQALALTIMRLERE